MPTRRRFLESLGAAAGTAVLAGCGNGGGPAAGEPNAPASGPTPAPPSPSPAPPPAPSPAPRPPPSPEVQRLQEFLRLRTTAALPLPELLATSPVIGWTGPLAGPDPATTLPRGRSHPISSPEIGGPLRAALVGGLPGDPRVAGFPALALQRRYTDRGGARSGTTVQVHRLRTDAAVVELGGVLPADNAAVITILVDGRLVPPTSLSASRGFGGWMTGAIRIDFGSRALREIWIEIGMPLAYVRIDEGDTLHPVEDSAEPQITAVGDSYLAGRSVHFANGGAIALEAATRLGIRRVAIDGLGGTGYWNTNRGIGNLGDRLPGHGADGSAIYLVMAGLNDYGDITPSGDLVFPPAETYERAVQDYLQGLRAANPAAVLVVTAPFCPIPSLSDSTYVVSRVTNPSGQGDFLYKAELFERCLARVAGPWVWIDVLMGRGWKNSAGATGDATGLQWFTGGTPGPGTTATHRPGNTGGRGGGGYGGVARVPVLAGGRYRQGPDVRVRGGSGTGLLLASSINAEGRLRSVDVVCPGRDYTPGSGLPTIELDRTYAVEPATLGPPELFVGLNPEGQYPLTSFAPPGATPADLNNVHRLLMTDGIHPSPIGAEHLGQRLARNIYDAVMAL